MQNVDGRLVYSASDLNNYLECTYLTELDRLVALGEKHAPDHDDPQAELIARKGDEHERRYLGHLHQRYAGALTTLARPEKSIIAFEAAQVASIAAMERGDSLIYQPTFFDGRFLGHPDFLRRIDVPCARWTWSYEVIDTKLALQTKPYFLIQLCNYSEHLARIQGTMPEYCFIVLGSGEERRFRVNDYAAYYRHLKARFIHYVTLSLSKGEDGSYPNKCSHCNVCKWSENCAAQRKSDDHLSLVAWMRRDQIQRLNAGGITAITHLARARDDQRPPGMNPNTFTRLRRQATLQVRARTEGPIYDLIEHHPWEGFGLMPAPAHGDVFFDMEGDPLYQPTRGLEYLFGTYYAERSQEVYRAFWALDRSQEKRAFEDFIDFIVERRKQYPGMHVYHYADYERAALRRLAQAHATREEAVDELLRSEVFVDLFAVVRQSLVISEDSYSLKRLEKFYALKRLTAVQKGDDSIVMFEQWLQDRSRTTILEDIERYNQDDCRSTLLLRDWLLERRREAIADRGIDIPFRQPKDAAQPCHTEANEECKSCQRRLKDEREASQTSDLQRRLLKGILTPQTEQEYAVMSDHDRARYLLGNLLAYHRREEKPAWWAFFDRCENVDKLAEFDKDAIGGLEFRALTGKEKNSNLYTYAFPEQPYKLAVGDTVMSPTTGKRLGKIFRIDEDENYVTIKSTCTIEEANNVRALIPDGPLRTDEQKASLIRIAESYEAGTLSGATLDLVLSRDPRVKGQATIQPDLVTTDSVGAVVQALDNSYLFIQGPPGSGKSTIGSQIICDLLAARKRVGVMSNSHKAIHNLLHKVEECAQNRAQMFTGLYKYSKDNSDSQYISRLLYPRITSHSGNEPFETDDYNLAAGTAWLFAREAMQRKFDYLFIDEAGQVSLADAIAVSAAAKNVVLLGDPLQLAQVSQGRHPIHAGDSVLHYLLGGAQTISKHRGIFLDRSYRMHPNICDFISRSVYGGRLHAMPSTAKQRVTLPRVSRPGVQTICHPETQTTCQPELLEGSGLRYIPLSHEGNSRESVQEAERISNEIAVLLKGTVTEYSGVTRAMQPSDIIVVTPYNAQRRLIANVLRAKGLDVRVGTVDKFQGQEAFVVFYSMATSSGADVPRDGFLFEPNRFNVAVSRARAMSVLVCSPRLLDVSCANSEQIASVNLLCAFVELSYASEIPTYHAAGVRAG
jgi:predicted RecB family nuclease